MTFRPYKFEHFDLYLINLDVFVLVEIFMYHDIRIRLIKTSISRVRPVSYTSSSSSLFANILRKQSKLNDPESIPLIAVDEKDSYTRLKLFIIIKY